MSYAGGKAPVRTVLVAKLSTVAYGRLHTRMRDESDDNELMNAELLELQIQIGVGKAAGTPVLEGHDVAHLRRELAADLATPGPVLEGLCAQAAFWMGAMYFQVS